MYNFKLKSITYITSDNKISNYEFGEITFFHGENKKGKTVLFNTIDFLFGKQNLKDIQMDHSYSNKLKEIKLIFEKDGEVKSVRYFIENSKVNKIKYCNIEQKKDKFKDQITEDIYGSLFEGENVIGIRNLLIFNFLHETNIGPNSVFLSKVKNGKYFHMLKETFHLALCDDNNDHYFVLEKKKKDLKQDIAYIRKQKKEMKLYKQNKKKLEKDYDISFFKESDSKKLNDQLNYQKLIEIKNILESNKILNEEKMFLENILNNTELLQNEIDEINYQLEIIREVENKIKRTKYINENLSSKISESKAQISSEFDEKVKLVKFLNNYIGEIDLEELEKLELQKSNELEEVKVQINSETEKLQNALDKVGEIMLYYFKGINDSENTTDYDFESNISRVVLSGNNFDPNLEKKNNTNKFTTNYIGSHGHRTIFQLCYYLALHEYSFSKDKNILPFVCIDSITQPLDEINSEVAAKIINKFSKKNKVQIIMFDHSDKILKNLNENVLTLYDLSEGLIKE